MDETPCVVALALNDETLSCQYAAVLVPSGYNVRVLPPPVDVRVLDDVDILVIEVDAAHLEHVAGRLRARRGLFRGVIVGVADATVSPQRRQIAIHAGFSEVLCGPCGPDALLALVERLRTIRPDDVPCEPDVPAS